MENYFKKFRDQIIGINTEIPTPDGDKKRIVYADWTASGRNFGPIETRLQNEIMPLVANTHSELSATGMAMTHAYHVAQQVIKRHVNAGEEDVIITAGSGMTRLINKFQRILGFKKQMMADILIPESERPVVFVTHMEHHSNQTSWLETVATVKIIDPTPDGLVDLASLDRLLEQYKDRRVKIASITAASNVTGLMTPYHAIAQKMHAADGLCFVDFACSAPYVDIDMHPDPAVHGEGAHLDAIFFSPHKFLGGPGSAAVLVFNRKLYQNQMPDNPGGGTVDWTNPWGEHKYIDDIEVREDGGTPAFLQTIKTAMCVTLKEEMGVENILAREHELTHRLLSKLETIPNVRILAPEHHDRLGVISFYIEDLHFMAGVKLLNDKYGIQVRGGCSCAGTYGHYLLNIDQETSKAITDLIDQGNLSQKPGWIRASLHPTMTDAEIDFIGDSIAELAAKHHAWQEEYFLDTTCGNFQVKVLDADQVIKMDMERSLTTPFVAEPEMALVK